MKTILERIVFIIAIIIVFVLYYCILSLIGLLFGLNYIDVIGNVMWFVLYALFIGWWLTGLTFFYEKFV